MQSRTVCFLAIALLAGCGGGGPKSDPEAIHDMLANAAKAVSAGDGDKACGYLTPEAQQQVVTIAGGAFGGSDCAGVVKLLTATLAPLDRKQIEDAEPQNITVAGTTGTADVVTPSATNQGQTIQLTLQKIGGDWKVSSLQL